MMTKLGILRAIMISTRKWRSLERSKMVVQLYLVVMTIYEADDDFSTFEGANQSTESVKEDRSEVVDHWNNVKRDEFFGQDTMTWDRALQLINQDDADIIGGRDRSKFKEIL
nr:ALI_HP1_G0023530.mRNA.1.CDS.1 [Saccharomyces cerevisiae]